MLVDCCSEAVVEGGEGIDGCCDEQLAEDQQLIAERRQGVADEPGLVR